MSAHPAPTLLTTAEAARRLRVTVHALIDWRRPGCTAGAGLPWVRVGRRVFYRSDDVAAVIERRQFGSAGTVRGVAPAASGGSGELAVEAA